MLKKYLDVNTYDAAMARLDFIFNEFDNIYVSFSGGKDSGLLLNMCIDYMKRHNISKKIGVFFQDYEAQYQATIQYVHEMLEKHQDYITPYWIALPVKVRNAASVYEPLWYPWDPSKKNLWVRDMPKNSINLKNHSFDFFEIGMSDYLFYDEFLKWYASQKEGKTCCLVGIRADESIHRFRTIRSDKNKVKDHPYIIKKGNDVYNAYPIYDMTTEDVWIANGKNHYPYNSIYDLFYKAGLSIHQMRVASPFLNEGIEYLRLWRVLEPDSWIKVCSRVSGANFMASYKKALSYQDFKLPENHTWKSYTKFLLQTLPEETANHYRRKFIKSLQFWDKTGGGLSEETIKELKALDVNFKRNGFTSYGRKNKERIIMSKMPDEVDALSQDHKDVPSWKRMAITILRNDYLCQYMGFSQTKEQSERQKMLLKKYGAL